MNYAQLAEMAQKAGFTAWAPLNMETIQLKQEVRDMCAANACGMYGKRWSCPPGCGTLTECAQRLRDYAWGILVQTVGDVEDGFDFEAMMEIEKNHKEVFLKMYQTIRESGEKVLAIGSGCCTVCGNCTYPEAPCRFPEKQVSSMEAYGMLVLEVCKENGLPYYYGPEKMAYTSCFLLQKE